MGAYWPADQTPAWTPEQRRAYLDELDRRAQDERCAASRARGDGCTCDDVGLRHAPTAADELVWMVEQYRQR